MSGNNKGDREAELEVFNRFSQIVKEKFSSLADGRDGDAGKDRIDRIDSLYKRPEFASEKRILNDMNNMGLHKGVMSGVACLAFLRFAPRAIGRLMQRRAARNGTMMGGDGASATNNPFHHRSPAGYEFDPPAAVGTRPNNNGRPGFFFRVFRLSLDTFVSLSVGAYASLYFIDKDKMMKKFAEIPLVEGRSLLSEELCGDFAKEFKKFDRRTWDANHPSLTSGVRNVNVDDGRDFRNTILGFVANCRRRGLYEREMRITQGLGDDAIVAIPPPGVPSDIAVSLDDLFEEEERDEVGMNGDDYFDTPFNMGDDEQV
ncbi:hypothetical protein ACHAW5_007532 [Stephanodiscus triporus]|uniref:Uncharacterized protein n=1 Tax=Stephanodiscus triporus TaxID=2934178 RepID=A0ABD3NTN7_9STRA